MSSRFFAILSGVLSLLGLLSMFYGAYLFDNHLLSSKLEVFTIPFISLFGSLATLVFGLTSKEY
mgnify:CR=1 FL=1